jgi:hypothetical protein
MSTVVRMRHCAIFMVVAADGTLDDFRNWLIREAA